MRELPLDVRAGTAIWGHLGIDWDPTRATPAERARLAEWVALYQDVRGLLHSGVLVHGDLADPAYHLTGVVADCSAALVAVTATATSAAYPPGTAALPGLDPDRTYRVRPQPPGDVADGNAAAWGVRYPGGRRRGCSCPGVPWSVPARDSRCSTPTACCWSRDRGGRSRHRLRRR